MFPSRLNVLLGRIGGLVQTMKELNQRSLTFTRNYHFSGLDYIRRIVNEGTIKQHYSNYHRSRGIDKASKDDKTPRNNFNPSNILKRSQNCGQDYFRGIFGGIGNPFGNQCNFGNNGCLEFLNRLHSTCNNYKCPQGLSNFAFNHSMQSMFPNQMTPGFGNMQGLSGFGGGQICPSQLGAYGQLGNYPQLGGYQMQHHLQEMGGNPYQWQSSVNAAPYYGNMGAGGINPQLLMQGAGQLPYHGLNQHAQQLYHNFGGLQYGGMGYGMQDGGGLPMSGAYPSAASQMGAAGMPQMGTAGLQQMCSAGMPQYGGLQMMSSTNATLAGNGGAYNYMNPYYANALNASAYAGYNNGAWHPMMPFNYYRRQSFNQYPTNTPMYKGSVYGAHNGVQNEAFSEMLAYNAAMMNNQQQQQKNDIQKVRLQQQQYNAKTQQQLQQPFTMSNIQQQQYPQQHQQYTPNNQQQYQAQAFNGANIQQQQTEQSFSTANVQQTPKQQQFMAATNTQQRPQQTNSQPQYQQYHVPKSQPAQQYVYHSKPEESTGPMSGGHNMANPNTRMEPSATWSPHYGHFSYYYPYANSSPHPAFSFFTKTNSTPSQDASGKLNKSSEWGTSTNAMQAAYPCYRNSMMGQPHGYYVPKPMPHPWTVPNYSYPNWHPATGGSPYGMAPMRMSAPHYNFGPMMGPDMASMCNWCERLLKSQNLMPKVDTSSSTSSLRDSLYKSGNSFSGGLKSTSSEKSLTGESTSSGLGSLLNTGTPKSPTSLNTTQTASMSSSLGTAMKNPISSKFIPLESGQNTSNIAGFGFSSIQYAAEKKPTTTEQMKSIDSKGGDSEDNKLSCKGLIVVILLFALYFL